MDDLTVDDLLHFYCDVLSQLRHRGIVRSSNLVGDYTEWLVSTKMGLSLCRNSNAGYDALDSAGVKYQIKGRQLTSKNKSTQLSAIRNLDSKDFNFLIAVIFDERFSILYAGQIPYELVRLQSREKTHDNSHIMSFPQKLLRATGVVDLTLQLRRV